MSTSLEATGLAEGLEPKHKWKILFSLVAGSFLIYLDMTIVNVALTSFREELKLDIADLQWVMSVYVLAMGVSTPLSGMLADTWGSKRAFVAALCAFSLGSLFAGAARGLGMLLVGRVIQGLGGGIASPLANAQLLRAFPKREHGTALGVFGLVLVIAPASGPLVGGWFVDNGLWRWAFWVNIPIGLVGILLSSRYLPNFRALGRRKLDVFGVAICSIGLAALLYGASRGGSAGWGDPWTVGSLVLGAAALAVFVPHELWRAEDPLVDLRVYRVGRFASSSMLAYISVIALFGAEFLFPIYLQTLRGLSGMAAGAILLPIALGAGFTMPIAGKLYDKVGPRVVIALGYGLLLFNSWQMSQLNATTPERWLVALSAMRGVAIGLTAQSAFASAMSLVPREAIARATALITGTRYVIQALGVALLATVAASPISEPVHRWEENLTRSGVNVLGICNSTSAAAHPGPIALACREHLEGLSLAYQATLALAVLGLMVGTLLPGWPGPWHGREEVPKR